MSHKRQINIVFADTKKPFTSKGYSSDFSVFGITNSRFLLAVTAVSGTAPTLDVHVRGKTNSGNYINIARFTQATGITTESLEGRCLPNICRIEWEIGGTNPSFIFEIDAVQDENP